jgi:hypothetical protein
MKNQKELTTKLNCLVEYYVSCNNTYTENNLTTLKMLVKSFSKSELKTILNILSFRRLKNMRILYSLINRVNEWSKPDNFINSIITNNYNILNEYNFENIHNDINTFNYQSDSNDNLISLKVTNKLGNSITIDCTKNYYTTKNINIVVKHLLIR